MAWEQEKKKRILIDNPTNNHLILKKHRKNSTSEDNQLDYSLVRQEHGKWPSCSVRKIKTIYDLPEELLSEILKRLPIKYILRCRCVLKSWYSLVRTSTFVTLHLNYQKEIAMVPGNENPKYLFFQNTYMSSLTVRFDDVQCQRYGNIKFLSGLPRYSWYAISHGLICGSPINTFVDGRYIYLWNPLVQKYKTLPDSPLTNLPQTIQPDWEALAFGFLPDVNDYVVVHVFKPRVRCQCQLEPDFFEPDEPDSPHSSCNCEPDPHTVIIAVYSLTTNSWKKLSQDNVFIYKIISRDAAFVNGIAFWVGHNYDDNKIIMCFDTKTDMLREISLPDWLEDNHTSTILYSFGQSIAYFVENRESNHLDMWILEGDPMNKFSWEKKVSVGLSKDIRVEVLGMRNNGEPILIKSYSLLSYNLDNHEPNEFVDTFEHWDPSFDWDEGLAIPYLIKPFTESLVLLDMD